MVDKSRPPRSADPESSSDLPARLGRNLSARRKALGLTQAGVAERLGVDTETLSRFERGKHVPSLQTLERLAETLGSTCAELLGQTPPAPSSDALMVETWLSGLKKKDAAFALQMLKACCDHLAGR
ncbi:helix-turn-helix transcriptional regulator [Paucibacter sp. R3-3]|uniref:Helix-turn-helix transcriptional regulator n=1 Tax=Roseateles agri TaxID=3098619 RepID=A0ABU5DAV6_9BURK|nr:helix-turn-helix transcriptional regulator [Paucibacter sp. R3-3]MDY0743396.1 helix-turn-helix transcriptional regulator [Paucibacter sp. R3-3]